jgi:hypothetical protein
LLYSLRESQICRILAIRAAEEIKREALVRIAHRRRLRPAVRPKRGNRHDPLKRAAILIRESFLMQSTIDKLAQRGFAIGVE